MSVPENLRAVRERIVRAGGEPDQITIVAVTKGFGPEMCREAIAAGLHLLGENRVQEAVTKMAQVEGAEWHLIGHLQTNKVKLAARRFALIHSVDSLHLAETLARADPTQQVLVEVNVARESEKTGVDPAKALDLIAATSDLLDLRGLMTIGPIQGDPRPCFRELRALRDEAQQRCGKPFPILSMGMSADFEAAVAEGSNMLRLGQVLFGPRPN